MNAAITIIDFEPSLAHHFCSLNMEWLQRYFAVEPIDRDVLGDPAKHIILPGGCILFAEFGAAIIGTCALMPEIHAPGRLELTKMAVKHEYQGRGVGRALLDGALSRFKRINGQMLFLETNSRLKSAIHLYESVGFQHRPRPGQVSPYTRADIYMVYCDPMLRGR